MLVNYFKNGEYGTSICYASNLAHVQSVLLQSLLLNLYNIQKVWWIDEAQPQVRQLINGMAKRPNKIHLAL